MYFSAFNSWHNYLYGINCLITLVSVGEILISRRLFLVTLPDSRELKWSWPAFLFKIFCFLVILKRLAVALWVFIFGIKSFTRHLNKKQVKYLVLVFLIIACLLILY